MAMTVTQEWRHTQNFMLAMNVKQEEVSESDFPFGQAFDVRMIDNFTILVNGVTKYSQFAVQVRTIYYDLCCSEGSVLHENLLKSVDSKLADEIISETTNIANAIRACKLPPSHADCVMWEKTLHASELLDMDVGFLHTRLKGRLSMPFKYEVAMKSKRFLRARLHQLVSLASRAKRMRSLDSKPWRQSFWKLKRP
ncbi:hypothetical protein EV1_034332 [Malus domestica]